VRRRVESADHIIRHNIKAKFNSVIVNLTQYVKMYSKQHNSINSTIGLNNNVNNTKCVDQSMLSVLQWNCHGISIHKEEFKQHLASSSIKYDIICLQETMLKPTSKFDDSFVGYKTVRRDRLDRSGGGLITLVSTDLDYSELSVSSDIECIFLKIKTHNGYVNVANVYLPPNYKFDKHSLITVFEPNSVVVGDFNSKSRLWGCGYSDSRGRIIEDILEDKNFCCINNGQATYTHYDGTQSRLDLSLVCRKLAAKSNWNVCNNTMGSDHNPAVTRLFDQNIYWEPHSEPKFNLSKADWANFKDRCRSYITVSNVEALDVNEHGDRLTAAIISAAEDSIPRCEPRSNKRRSRPLPYWNERCKKAVADRNRARNALCNRKTQDNITKYRHLKGIAQHEIKSSSREYWQQYCSTITSQTKLGNVWRMAKRMSGTSSDAKINTLSLGDTVAETDKAKAEAFADTFSNISSNKNFSPTFLQRKTDVETNQKVLFENEPALDENVIKLNEPFSIAELRRAIREGKCNKATGYDNISYEMLKQLPKNATKVLLNYYNKLWIGGIFPSAWRHSIVLPVLKQGKSPTDPTSYRPISLTSTLCKVLEKMVATRLAYHLEKHNVLCAEQSGFRAGRSTMDQLMRLQDTILKHNYNKGYTVGVFIDFSSAFDMVWQKGLLIKMKNMGLTGNIFGFVDNFLTNRTMQVRVGGELSDTHILENGTAQGSVISPILFLLMINDIAASLRGVQTSLFADDSCIYKSGRNLEAIVKCIQSNLDKIVDWCELWGFKINVSKTVAVLFTHRIDKIESNILIRGQPIKIDKTVKFLGLIFDSKLSWNAHIAHIEEKCKKRLNLMRMLSGQTWGASKSSLLIVYRMLIRSVLDYGSIAYNTTSLANKRRLDVIQHKALRIACRAFCTTSVSSMEVETGEMPLQYRREQQELNYALKLDKANSHPTKSILQRDRLALNHKFTQENRPFCSRVKEFMDKHSDIKCEGPRPSELPRWHLPSAVIDKSLTQEVSKKENREILKQISMSRIELYDHTLKIYTDASKTSDNRTSAAFYIPELKLEEKARLSDNLTIFAAEVVAILLALNWVHSGQNIDRGKSVTIFSDSLSAINALELGKSVCRPNLVNKISELLVEIPNNITFVWIPSHIGIQGNEIVDRLANTAIMNKTTDLDVPLELQEAYKIVETFMLRRWQNAWNECSTGQQYKAIEPLVSGKVKFTSTNRRKEITITRLRLGKCRLNAYLKEISAHPDGLCESCHTAETVEHFLLHCCNRVTESLRNACHELNVEPKLATVLSDHRLIEVIYRNLDKNRRI